jgi:hypothetical protein
MGRDIRPDADHDSQGNPIEVSGNLKGSHSEGQLFPRIPWDQG